LYVRSINQKEAAVFTTNIFFHFVSSSESEGGHIDNLALMPHSPISSGGFVWSATTSTSLPGNNARLVFKFVQFVENVNNLSCTGISHGQSDQNRDENPLPNVGLPDRLILEPVLHNLDARLHSPDAVNCNGDAVIAHIHDIPDFPDPEPSDHGEFSLSTFLKLSLVTYE